MKTNSMYSTTGHNVSPVAEQGTFVCPRSCQNPRATVIRHPQHRFSGNICAGIFGDGLVGLYILPQHLTGAECLVFLKKALPGLLDSVPHSARMHM